MWARSKAGVRRNSCWTAENKARKGPGEINMKRLAHWLAAASVLGGTAALAQGTLNYTAGDPVTYPAGIYAGEVAGVATNSKGDILVFQRAGNPYASLGGSRIFVHGQDQLLELDTSGKF